MREMLLHGTLHVTIYEVEGLPHRKSLLFFHKLLKRSASCCGFGKGVFELYATFDVGKATVGRTRLLESEKCNHQWNESFHIHCAHVTSHIKFSIKGFNPIGATVIGTASMPVDELMKGEEVNTWLSMSRQHGKGLLGGAKIHVKLWFESVTRDLNWSRGIKGDPEFPGVPYTYFSQRTGCKVSLYQDAHVPNDFTPNICLSDGTHYKPHRCWEDIFDAISNAKHLIYIAGWSVYTKISLVRDPERKKQGGDMILGELLKKKADEGVKVLMLVWDDRTSVKLLKKDGLMATHDEDTGSYFHNSRVHCVLCPRNPDNGHSIVQDIEISTMFSHHQKIVIVDSAISECEDPFKRRIVSFIGGIDLCDGRYDTPYHSIFKTLGDVHKEDFHQPNFPGASIAKGGPREPWHDIHCQLEGPIAWDVLRNFEQRWRKQGIKDLLVPVHEQNKVFISQFQNVFSNDSETWNVQLFRSIDGGAAFGLPETPDEAAEAGLVSGKDHIIDRSIHRAYVNAIRRAKNFIYIENQYFLGSSYYWNSDDIKVKEIGAIHLIPKELSLKIVSKIEQGERFTVYIVMPMWPEGKPESPSVQEILNWQKRTMDMMYRDISKAISDKGLEADPMDYLTFFCLGNREAPKDGEYTPPGKPEENSDYYRAQKSRRFMIYVHAKTMIVDDEYIIVGSANINQRSMDGARDTEIAMGAYQPHHLASEHPARGQVYGFRMALWHEHLNEHHYCFNHPESLDCVKKVNEIATRNWQLYTSEEFENDLPSHLLKYPIAVSEDGEVVELPDMEFFPDTKARILGAKKHLLPAILTT